MNELLCGMNNAQFLELLIADQVAEGAQTDLRVLQQLIGHQHLLVGVQLSRRIRGLEESEQFICGRDTVRCVMLYFLPNVVDDLLFSVGGQKVQQLLLALFKWIHSHTRSFVFG